MEKILKEKQIFWEQKNEPFTWKDIKDIPLEDDDILNIGYTNSFYSENESWDGHYHAEVLRMVLETDEQFEERKADRERDKKEAKERRLASYLKLKEEFEGNI
jgi:hypothetical protein